MEPATNSRCVLQGGFGGVNGPISGENARGGSFLEASTGGSTAAGPGSVPRRDVDHHSYCPGHLARVTSRLVILPIHPIPPLPLPVLGSWQPQGGSAHGNINNQEAGTRFNADSRIHSGGAPEITSAV